MVKRVADKFAHLDVLVNNAGITRDAMLRKMTDENWVEVIQTNLNACFFCTSAAIPIMTAQKLRADRQHQLDERPDRRRRSGELQRQQRRHHRLHPDGGHGIGQVGHHRQQRLARLHRDRHVRQGPGGYPGADQGQDSAGSIRASPRKSPRP